MSQASIRSNTELADRLLSTGHLGDGGRVTLRDVAVEMLQPLLVGGPPLRGKTALAEAFAQTPGIGLIRLQCPEGFGGSQAIYGKRVLPARPIMQALPGERPWQSSMRAAPPSNNCLPSAYSLWRFEDMLEVLSDA